ncbi:hypothetical protein [Mesorhizobium sp. CAU 1741]|uniref:hypothetical protein n=1 Tax=Mesorhizobium sp. CAU 1741 TaxID=3140366 RepID=UPI00325A9BD3
MIGWRDLQAWRDMTSEAIEPWEARLIVRLSNLQARIASEEAKAKPAPKPAKRGR